MSFLFRGDVGPTNIPEARGLFQAIAQAGLQSAQENNFGGRRRVKSRMAGEGGGRRRSRLDEVRVRERRPRPDIGVGGGLGIPPKFPPMEGGPAPIRPKNPRGYLPFHRGPNKRRNVDERPRIRPPKRMTKEEYDNMPKKPRRERNMPPNFGDLIDKFPSPERPGIRPPRDRRLGIRPPRDEVSIMPIPPLRRSNDDIRVGFGLKENPRRRRRRRSAQEKQEIRKRGSQRFRGREINEQSN